MLRKLSRVIFGIYLPAVDFDVEDSPAAFNQFGINALGVPNGIRQTGGFGQVVSRDAVEDRDVHGGSLRWGL